MTFRTLSIAAIAIACSLGFAHAAADGAPVSTRPDPNVPSLEATLTAYRQYAKTQADSLVGMTRVLAREIRDGNLAAAQMAYAPAHRYLASIAPIARTLRALDERLDARADGYAAAEADPAFVGFHRVEYGLFANKSTKDLADAAARLDKDARALRQGLAGLDVTPAALLDGAIGSLDDMAATSLTGAEERYSGMALWDFEAKVEGARRVVAILQPRLRTQRPETLASATAHFAAFDALIETHKVGCGFKSYSELSRDDRLALRAPIAALADDLSKLRDTSAMD